MSANAGRVLNGRYRLIRTVGVGSQASVWVAEHLALTTQVAVKLIDPDLAKRPDARERFKREATAAAQLRSPHVVQILDHGIDGDQPFIVMELLDGEDLFQRLEKRHHLSIKDTSKILTQVARALTRAHAAGVVHRDLKPENVFLTHNEDDEIVKVLDFGVAKVRDAAKVTMQKTGVGTLIGTPHYMSPEQVKGIGEVDYRTDIWAMGVLGFQCVTGELPFDSEGVGDLLIRITIGDMPVPSKVMMGLPPAFDGWFARACDRDPARRFASARACAEGLARIAGLAAAGSGGPTAVPRPGASIPPPADPTKRASEVPPPPAAKAPAKPPGPPPNAKAKTPAPDEIDDDWEEEIEPMISVAPPAGPEAVTEEIPAAPKLPFAARPRPLIVEPEDDDEARPLAPVMSPSEAQASAPVAAAHMASADAGAIPAPPPSRSGAPPVEGPVNPFLVNDFIAPSNPPSHAVAASPSQGGIPAPSPSQRAIPAAPPSHGARPIPQPPVSHPATPAYQMPPVSQGPHSTVTGIETTDIDDSELGIGRNRRTKLVRWFAVGLALLVVAVVWAVVSSQLRARDPAPETATAPPSAPTIPPAFDPAPTVTESPSATTTTSAAPTVKLTGKLRPPPAPTTTGQSPRPTATVAPKKPTDGSVELPTPDDLPPPAP
ncbi:MAG: protein kinase [Polyangiaceae bacterium]